MARLQESRHNASFDYEGGTSAASPPRLRGAIVERIRGLVLEQFGRRNRVRVLELGAGRGAFASFPDPLWYPRRSRANLLADRASYFACRLGRGKLISGAATRLRRLRGVYDQSNPADMVEYHVVRQGCDEEALSELLARHFDKVELWRYWSTQSAVLQRLGTRFAAPTTFGLSARDRRLGRPARAAGRSLRRWRSDFADARQPAR